MEDVKGIETALKAGNQVLSVVATVLQNLFPRSVGTFTMTAASSRSVTDANVTTSSAIVLIPRNASAGVLQGSNECLFITPAAGSFTVTTGAGTAAAGTESFQYLVFNPL